MRRGILMTHIERGRNQIRVDGLFTIKLLYLGIARKINCSFLFEIHVQNFKQNNSNLFIGQTKIISKFN